MRFNLMRKVHSMFILMTLFLLASGFADIELIRVFGNAGNALYAAEHSRSAKALRTKKTSSGKTNKISNKKNSVPQEWQWFDKPLNLGNVEYSEDKIEEKTSKVQPNASFQLALAKMQQIKNKRTARDLELLAKIKASEKSVSMMKMNQKIKEISRRAGLVSGESYEPEIINTPVVAPSFVPVPSSLKTEAPKVNNRNHRNHRRPSRIGRKRAHRRAKNQINENINQITDNLASSVPTYSAEIKKEATKPTLSGREVASGLATPVMTNEELNEMIAIDDLVAVDNEPPAIVPFENIVSSNKQVTSKTKKIEGYNRYAPKPVENVEILYRGVGDEYSDRINVIVNERKEKIFGSK